MQTVGACWIISESRLWKGPREYNQQIQHALQIRMTLTT